VAANPRPDVCRRATSRAPEIHAFVRSVWSSITTDHDQNTSWQCLVWSLRRPAGILGQVSAPPALLDDGRHFVAQLRLEPNADDVLFQATGLDRSNQLMETVVHAGLDGDATLDDWANLHRALAGQAELATERGNFGGAIVYLTMQEAYYNALESASDAA